MDTAWLKNFFSLAPLDRDVVLVDDSEEENEQISDNTCTGAPPSLLHLRLPLLCASWDLQLSWNKLLPVLLPLCTGHVMICEA